MKLTNILKLLEEEKVIATATGDSDYLQQVKNAIERTKRHIADIKAQKGVVYGIIRFIIRVITFGRVDILGGDKRDDKSSEQVLHKE